jgi:hypothetical protein
MYIMHNIRRLIRSVQEEQTYQTKRTLSPSSCSTSLEALIPVVNVGPGNILSARGTYCAAHTLALLLVPHSTYSVDQSSTYMQKACFLPQPFAYNKGLSTAASLHSSVCVPEVRFQLGHSDLPSSRLPIHTSSAHIHHTGYPPSQDYT